ncbi:extracellular solute-binding protein, partial [bacterium]|nr:extracellular solute-binding protein [bacterium]
GSMTTAQMFINEKLSMYLGGRWLVPKFRETINFDWDIIEFPSTDENKVYIDASGWAIAAKSRKTENSLKLIKFLSSDKSIEKFAKSGLIIPARKDVSKKYIKEDKQNKPQHSKIFIDMLDRAKPTPVNKNYNKINDIINEEIQTVLSGKENANEAFNNKVIKKIEGLL